MSTQLSPSQYPFTLNRFFQLLKEAVKFFPDTDTISLKTFSVNNSVDDLNSTNLGVDLKRAKTDYFLSKRYEKKKTTLVEFDFPILICETLDGSLDNQFKPDNQSRKINRVVKLWILDEYKKSKDVTGTNADRELEDVQRDTNLILLRVLAYFDKVKFVQLNTGSTTTYGYYNTDYLDYLISQGQVTSYATTGIVDRVNNWFKNMIEQSTGSDLNKVDPISERQVAGCSTIIKFQEAHCINPTFNFSFTSNDFIYGQ
jgi:hypothetical protein